MQDSSKQDDTGQDIAEQDVIKKEIARQRPHFPRILESRRRAQEQTNVGAPKKRHAEAASARTASEAGASAGRAQEGTPATVGADEQG